MSSFEGDPISLQFQVPVEHVCTKWFKDGICLQSIGRISITVSDHILMIQDAKFEDVGIYRIEFQNTTIQTKVDVKGNYLMLHGFKPNLKITPS